VPFSRQSWNLHSAFAKRRLVSVGGIQETFFFNTSRFFYLVTVMTVTLAHTIVISSVSPSVYREAIVFPFSHGDIIIALSPCHPMPTRTVIPSLPDLTNPHELPTFFHSSFRMFPDTSSFGSLEVSKSPTQEADEPCFRSFLRLSPGRYLPSVRLVAFSHVDKPREFALFSPYLTGWYRDPPFSH